MPALAAEGICIKADDASNYTIIDNNVANHKVAATLIGEAAKVQNIARFTGININGTTVPESKMAMYTDKAALSNLKDGNVAITVKN